jgi:hypothetical protein
VTRDTTLTISLSQSLHRRGFYCCQGLVNLNDCGPEDGGLMVLEGSSKLVEEFFDIHGRESYNSWGPFDWYGMCDGCVSSVLYGRPAWLKLTPPSPRRIHR